MKIETTKPVWTGLMTYLHGAGFQVFKYINDNKLLKILQTYIPTEPNDLDNLAKDLVVRNPDRVTVHKLLLCGQ
ncbi:37003_t:CDS:1, partial [Racocetra persica]